MYYSFVDKKISHENSVPLSLITFIVVSNWVLIKTTKFSNVLTTLDFCFKRNNRIGDNL